MGFLQQDTFQPTPKRRCKYSCDQCGLVFYRAYKARRAHNLHKWFCSSRCLGQWNFTTGLTNENLFSLHNREKTVAKLKKAGNQFAIRMKHLSQTKYGVDNVSQSQTIKARKKQTALEHYGVEHHWSVKEIRNKCHETMKLNKTYGKSSKGELVLLKMFHDIFGFEEVQHLVLVNGEEIDFYLKPIETYVQFDGRYWHGLDRPLEVIRASRNKRDKGIARRWELDRLQDSWFEKNNKKLVRITDLQLKKYQSALSGNRLSLFLKTLTEDKIFNEIG